MLVASAEPIGQTSMKDGATEHLGSIPRDQNKSIFLFGKKRSRFGARFPAVRSNGKSSYAATGSLFDGSFRGTMFAAYT
jgi:hypothetical protein